MAKKEGEDSDSTWIYSLILGAVAFASLLFVAKLGWGLAAAGGIAGLALGDLVFKPRPKFDKSLVAQGITKQMLEEALRDGKAKVANLRRVGQGISHPVVQFKVKQIAELADKILEDIRKDPIDLKAARPFLNYYLETTVKILSSYSELSAKKVLDPEVQKSLKRVEALLDQIRMAFQKQLTKLLENEVMDLDAEVQVLQKTIEMDHGPMEGPVGKPMGSATPAAGQSAPLA